MSMGLMFWILMLLWAVFGLAVYGGYGGQYGMMGHNLLAFILFLLLGWKVFGTPING